MSEAGVCPICHKFFGRLNWHIGNKKCYPKYIKLLEQYGIRKTKSHKSNGDVKHG